MARDLTARFRKRISTVALAAALLSLGCRVASSETPLPGAPAGEPAQQADAAGDPRSTEVRIVVVEWKIKKGHEQEFLDYWATKSTIPDRSGLIAEFMSGEESHDQFPWINWATPQGADYTLFYNIGFWRSADDFMGQIGKYIDNARPPMPFEADHRHRVFLAPLKWRIGMSSLPAKDAAGVR
jgi:hypothetical protein